VAGELLLSRPRAGVALLTLNRPEKLNALSDALLTQIAGALAELEGDGDVRVAVITGNEQAFAAGADLEGFLNSDAVSLAEGARTRAWGRIRAFPKPLIAAVEGYCLGGGFELALSADLIVAGAGARFGQPEVNLGLMPGAGGTQRLVRLLGHVRAMEILLDESRLEAEEARRLGVVNRVVPRGAALAEALDLAERIAKKPSLAVRFIKAAARQAAEVGLSEGLAYEQRSFLVLFESRDARERIQAFLEKRSQG